MGCEAFGTMYPAPHVGGHRNASGSANCQYQAVKGLGSGDMANRCEPP